MKKFLWTILTLILVFAFAASAFAAEAEHIASAAEISVDTNRDVSEEFMEVCDLLFAGRGEVYNATGTNITQAFTETYRQAYNNRNYTVILDGCYSDGISKILGHDEYVADVSTRILLERSYEEYAVHFVEQEGFPYDGKAWYFMVTASGTYMWQDGYQYIQSFPEPTITVSYHDLGAAFAGTLNSIRVTAPVLNSDRTSASFTVTTEHSVSCPIPGLDYVTGTLGPFSNISNFTVGP